MGKIIEQILARKIAFLSTFFVVFTLSYIVLMALDFLPEPVDQDSVEKSGSFEEMVNTTSQAILFRADQAISSSLDFLRRVPSQFASVDRGLAVDSFTAVEEGSLSDELVVEEEEIIVDEVVSIPFVSAALPIRIEIAKLDKSVVVLNPSSRAIADLDAALLEGVVRHPDSATLVQDGMVFILGHSSYLPKVFNRNFQAFNGIQDLQWGDLIEVYSDDAVYEYRVEKVYRAKAQDVTVPVAGTGKKLTLATCNSFGTTDDRYLVEAKQVSVRQL